LPNLIEFIGKVSSFGARILVDGLRTPFEGSQILTHIAEVGYKSLPLVAPAGFALGTVMTFHTRSTLGPLVAGLLLAGRVGSGIGAVLANMRVAEQIDAIESLSIDSFKLLVIPRVIACVIALPLLTLFMDFAGLLGGYLSEFAASGMPFDLYIRRAFANLEWANFIAPTLKTTVFGFIIGTVSSYFGYTTNQGAAGVGRAATNSVVVSSLLVIVADVILVKCIFFVFPESAL